ncbi:TIGR02206 family membrane protein [Bulleidia sp. zg-1006]|uniref:TMEM164-related integral membrane acyltransferase n=1 Tax=Bulleidia sp. zg-1006 TaxID=2806552 RepID=UPI00193A635C|nr:TIGR02206 family membrane protein [Bulleidia sp. zg-1006]QRG86255.1 TIGR02206 family membrane protein [Bulleidia sp. zg-1006]
MDQFFSTQGTASAFVPPMWVYVSAIIVMALEMVFCLKYHDKAWLKKFFWLFQLIQLVILYGFYMVQRISISISLPLYHCRAAMFSLMFMKDSKLKKMFAVIGIFGGLLAIFIPIMDKYAWPHVTLVSFYWGHFALFGNSLLYLLETKKKLSLKEIIGINLLIDVFLALVNELTNGNYGFLRETPLIAGWSFLARLVCVTLFFCLVTYGIQKLTDYLQTRVSV